MGILYRLTSPSGKSYIGITSKTLEERFAKHTEHALGRRTAGALYGAMRKYGVGAFTKEVIGQSDDWNELCRMEIEAIAACGTLAPGGYNCTTGGEGVLGPRSEEAKLAISAAQKKRFQNPEQREKELLALQKARQTKTAKRSAIKKTKPTKPKLTAEEISARIKEGMRRPEVAAKVKAAAAKRGADPEIRKKVADAKRGKKGTPRTEEWKQMMTELRKKEWADPEMRAKRLKALAAGREARKQRQTLNP